MKNEKWEVAVIGALNIDITGAANVPFTSGDSLPGEVSYATGGVGWNIARNAALLGAETGFVSVLGADGYASLIRADATACGVDIESCRWEAATNCSYLCILDADGNMTAAVNDMQLSRRMDVFFVKDAARRLCEAKVVVAECNLQADALRRLAEELGNTPLVADCVSAAKCMRLEALLPRIHTLKANLLEAERLTGYAGAERCATALLKKGVRRVCVTLGAEGMLLADAADMVRLPSAVTGTVVSSTGAGDAMTAALAVSLARGLDLERSARLATAAAAVATRCRAAVNPDLTRLRNYTAASKKRGTRT